MRRTGRKLFPFQWLESQVVKGKIFVGGCSCASSAGEIGCLGIADGIERGLLGWRDGLGLPGGLQGEGTRLGPGDGCRVTSASRSIALEGARSLPSAPALHANPCPGLEGFGFVLLAGSFLPL